MIFLLQAVWVEEAVHRHPGRVRERVHDGARLRGLEVEERELEGLQDHGNQTCRQQQGLDFIYCHLRCCLNEIWWHFDTLQSLIKSTTY